MKSRSVKIVGCDLASTAAERSCRRDKATCENLCSQVPHERKETSGMQGAPVKTSVSICLAVHDPHSGQKTWHCSLSSVGHREEISAMCAAHVRAHVICLVHRSATLQLLFHSLLQWLSQLPHVPPSRWCHTSRAASQCRHKLRQECISTAGLTVSQCVCSRLCQSIKCAEWQSRVRKAKFV
jgi:hypothetical protein